LEEQVQALSNTANPDHDSTTAEAAIHPNDKSTPAARNCTTP
jgi:hypothetical protein